MPLEPRGAYVRGAAAPVLLGLVKSGPLSAQVVRAYVVRLRNQGQVEAAEGLAAFWHDLSTAAAETRTALLLPQADSAEVVEDDLGLESEMTEMTVREAADVLKCSTRWARTLADRGLGRKVGTTWLLDAGAVRAMASEVAA